MWHMATKCGRTAARIFSIATVKAFMTHTQIYDTLPLDFAGLHTSATVPPLLAAFYIVLGALAPLSDAASGGEEDPATAQVCLSWHNQLGMASCCCMAHCSISVNQTAHYFR